MIEITSPTTRNVDLVKKHDLYRDILKVREYFLFDPLGEYLKPPLRGFRLADGLYQPIAAVNGRLPSEVLGLHLERSGDQLRLFDPRTGHWVPTSREEVAERDAIVVAKDAALNRSETENERLRREVEELRRRLADE